MRVLALLALAGDLGRDGLAPALGPWRVTVGHHARGGAPRAWAIAVLRDAVDRVSSGMTSIAQWDDLLAGEELAHLATEPPRAARTAPFPAGCTRSSRGARGARDRGALRAPGARVGARAARRARHRHDRHRLGEDARLQPARARRARRASRRTARSTSTRRRRSRRTSRARSLRCGAARRAAIYDGDTPQEQRWQIRKWANLVLTNPDMLHIGVLPRHDLLGATCCTTSATSSSTRRTSTAASSARTSRTSCAACAGMARVYGADPQFVLASATIANPGELAHALLGVDRRP